MDFPTIFFKGFAACVSLMIIQIETRDYGFLISVEYTPMVLHSHRLWRKVLQPRYGISVYGTWRTRYRHVSIWESYKWNSNTRMKNVFDVRRGVRKCMLLPHRDYHGIPFATRLTPPKAWLFSQSLLIKDELDQTFEISWRTRNGMCRTRTYMSVYGKATGGIVTQECAWSKVWV